MAQFDVFRNTNPASKARVPYLLDVQHDLLGALSTRVVIPLRQNLRPLTHLNPAVELNGESFYLSTAEMAGVPVAALGERVGSLEEERQKILGAVDFLITGF